MFLPLIVVGFVIGVLVTVAYYKTRERCADGKLEQGAVDRKRGA